MIRSKLTAVEGRASLGARTREGQLGELLAARWVKVRAQGPRLDLDVGLEARRRLEAMVMLSG